MALESFWGPPSTVSLPIKQEQLHSPCHSWNIGIVELEYSGSKGLHVEAQNNSECPVCNSAARTLNWELEL